MRWPSGITTCFRSRAMWKPTFSSAQTTSRWLTPRMRSTRSARLEVVDLNVAPQVVAHHEMLANRLATVGNRFRFGLALRPAARKARHGLTVLFVGVLESDLVLYR